MLEALRRRRRSGRTLGDWRQSPPPDRLTHLPSMLTLEERALLHQLGMQLSPGSLIVDAGCFLGGSTASLALGASRVLPEAAPVVHSYDLFLVDHSASTNYGDLIEGRPLGADLLPVFEHVVGPDLLPYVEVHKGDLLDARWDAGAPIEVLFVDVAKTWGLNDHVMREFFPSLVPGRSIVVQQDYVHEWLPWIHIAMELLADHFELIEEVPGSPSVVFACTRPVRPRDLPTALRDLPPGRLEELFDRAVGRFEGEDRLILECARAVLLSDLYGRERAIAHLECIGESEASGPRIDAIYPVVLSWAREAP
jgi:hypothetical protein